MRQQNTFLGLSLLLCTSLAAAQNTPGSVSLYGLIDAGVTHVSNVAGASMTTADSGQFQSSRLGFRGTEDLGGGLKALFTLEAGFSADTGAGVGAGLNFNRQSFVGLSGAFGTVTLGRQYDFLYVTHLPLGTELIVGGLESGISGGPGGSAGALKPIDLHYGGTRYDNSLKWVHTMGRVTVGYMRGKGLEKTVPGDTDQVDSALLHYRGERLVAGLAWTRDNYNAATSGNTANRVIALKAIYTAGPWRIYGNYGEGKSRNSRATNKPLAFGALYALTPSLDIGAGLGRARATNAAGARTHITQISLGAMYKFSHRTGVYLLAATNGSDDVAVYRGHVGLPGGASAPSSTDRQSVVRVGMVHRF